MKASDARIRREEADIAYIQATARRTQTLVMLHNECEHDEVEIRDEMLTEDVTATFTEEVCVRVIDRREKRTCRGCGLNLTNVPGIGEPMSRTIFRPVLSD